MFLHHTISVVLVSIFRGSPAPCRQSSKYFNRCTPGHLLRTVYVVAAGALVDVVAFSIPLRCVFFFFRTLLPQNVVATLRLFLGCFFFVLF